MLHDTEINYLMEKGFLTPERRHDHAAIEKAIGEFIYYSLECFSFPNFLSSVIARTLRNMPERGSVKIQAAGLRPSR
jgi:hypothetical protein